MSLGNGLRWTGSATALAAVLAALGPAALAQARDFTPYVGVRLGYIELEDVDEDGSFTFGLLGGLLLRGGFSVQGAVDFQESDFAIGTGSVDVTLPELERETIALQIGLGFTPAPDARVRPFAVGGMGYYFSEFSGRGVEQTVEDSGFFGGLGLDMLGEGWKDRGSLVVEVRWLFTRKEEVSGAGIRADGWTATLGWRFKF